MTELEVQPARAGRSKPKTNRAGDARHILADGLLSNAAVCP